MTVRNGPLSQRQTPATRELRLLILHLTGPIMSIRSKNATTYVSKIWVNGLALVEPLNYGQFFKKVEYQTKGGNGTVIEVNTGNNTLKIANTSDRDERWIG